MTRARIFRITLVSDNFFFLTCPAVSSKHPAILHTKSSNKMYLWLEGSLVSQPNVCGGFFGKTGHFFSLSKKYTLRVSFCWSLWWRTWMQIIWICSQLPRILTLWLAETRNGASSSSEPRTRVYKDFGGLHLYRWITISISRWVILQS